MEQSGQPDSAEALPAESENAPVDAASPNPPVSRRPEAPENRPPEPPVMVAHPARLFRPPAPDSPHAPVKASLAPAPRLRPMAPSSAAQGATIAAPAVDPGAVLSVEETSQLTEMPRDLGLTSAMPARWKPAPARDDSDFFRKTMVPVLLSFSVALFGWAVLILTSGPDNALPDLFPHWTPFALIAIGAFALILALLNIVAMKSSRPKV